MAETRTGKTQRVALDYPFDGVPEPGEAMQVAPGVYWVGMPLPIPSLKRINLWLIEDHDGWVMVDTGMDIGDSRQYWESVFAKVLKGRPITRVIVTHMHPDHAGLSGWVTRKFGCELWMSQLEYVTCRMLVADTGREAPQAGLDFYQLAGWDDTALRNYKDKFGGFGMAMSRLPDAYRRLCDGDVLTIGDGAWRVVTGGGHSPDHVCLLNEDLNLFISGDQLLPRISSNVSVFPTEPEANPMDVWLESCRKLKAALPEGVLTLPAHNEPFYGAHDRLQALIDGQERAMERLLARMREPKRVVDTFVSLFSRKLDADDMFGATGEALANLNCLRARGLVKREKQAGVYLYSRAP